MMEMKSCSCFPKPLNMTTYIKNGTNKLSVSLMTQFLIGYAWERSGQFQGDLFLQPPQTLPIPIHKRHWPNATVYYMISDERDFTPTELSEIRKAMEYIERVSCIKFVPSETDDWVHIVSEFSLGCSSYAGRKGGMQVLSLAHQCFEDVQSVVIHELLHALGFFHEMSREDRDEHVEIRYHNLSGFEMVEFNRSFSKQSFETFDFPYDFESVMHYSGETIAKVDILKKTPNGPVKGTFGRKEFGMSRIDILKLNKMYNCQKFHYVGKQLED